MLEQLIAGKYTEREVRLITSAANRLPGGRLLTIEQVTAVLEAAGSIRATGMSLFGIQIYVDSTLEENEWRLEM